MPHPDLSHVAAAVCASLGANLKSFLAHGAFKHTFLIESGTQLAALKILNPGFEIQRLGREVDAMTRCAHPNIAKLFHVSSVGVGSSAHTFLVEEYLAGGTLGQRIEKQGNLAPDAAHALARPLADALLHLRRLNLVHRDIKPDNVMFRADGMSPVLVDFGLVRDLEQESLTASFAMQGPGTPLFASPEQLRNDKALIDHRSDQFSLGVTLAYAVFGAHPYQAATEPAVAVIQKVADRRGPATGFASHCHSVGLPALPRMVDPWPVRRYRTAQDLVAAWS